MEIRIIWRKSRQQSVKKKYRRRMLKQSFSFQIFCYGNMRMEYGMGRVGSVSMSTRVTCTCDGDRAPEPRVTPAEPQRQQEHAFILVSKTLPRK